MKEYWKSLLRFFLSEFFIITVCVMFVIAAVNTLVYGMYPIDSSFPWVMLLTGFLGAVPTVLLNFRNEPTRRQFFVRVVLHFLSIEALILTEGALLGWFRDIQNFIVVAAMILAVYALVWGFSALSQRATADNINKALKKYNEDEEG